MKQARQQLQQDVDAMQAGELGFTDAQKRQQLAAATQQSAAQAAAGQGQIARAGLGGGVQGADIQALLAGQQGTAQAGAAASQQIQQASQQQAQQEEARIRDALERQQRAAAERGMQGAQMGIQAGMSAAALGMSDYRLKTDITHVGKSPKGVNIYEFRYKDPSHGEGRFRGVMAQEVPEAAFVPENSTTGHLWVDYAKVDVDFERVE